MQSQNLIILKKIKNSSSKVSSFLTIQEGCDKFCHFCVVPYTRGPEYSRSFQEIINEAKNLSENGVREIILLGQNVNAYKNKNFRLSDLILKLKNFQNQKNKIFNFSPTRYDRRFNKCLWFIKKINAFGSLTYSKWIR